MALGNTAKTSLMTLLFNNTAWGNVGNAGGLLPSATAGSWFMTLFTADPGVAGSQTTNEVTYTGYARLAIARSGAGWTVSGTAPCQAANTSTAAFAPCTAGSNTITHGSIGRETSGAGENTWFGALTAALAVSAGITPTYAAAAAVATIA